MDGWMDILYKNSWQVTTGGSILYSSGFRVFVTHATEKRNAR